MTNSQKFLVLPVLGMLAILGGVALGYAQLGSAYGNGNANGMRGGMMGEQSDVRDRVHGTITALQGDSITIETPNGSTYTVDASDATVRTFEIGSTPEEIDLSDLSVGNVIGVHGDIDGSVVDATDIMVGTPAFGYGKEGRGMRGGRGVMGEVTAVQGTNLTITTPDGRTFTVDADEATVFKTSEGSLGDVKKGDRINVHGTVNGTSVTAARIMTDLPEPMNVQE